MTPHRRRPARPSPGPRIPSYRLHKPSGQAVVTLAGRDHYLGRHGSQESLRRYARLIAEWETSAEAGPASHDLTVLEVLAAFWEHAEGCYRKGPDGAPTSTLHNFRLALRPVSELYGDTPAKAFGPKALKAVRGRFVAAGMSRRTVNQHVGFIRAVFKWAVSEELVPADVYRALTAVSGLRKGRTAAPDHAAVRPVAAAMIEAIREHVPAQVWALVRLQLLTAARAGELVSMRRCDLDTSGRVWTYKPASHNTAHHGHERTIYLGPKAQAIVGPYLLSRSPETQPARGRGRAARGGADAPPAGPETRGRQERAAGPRRLRRRQLPPLHRQAV